MGAFEDAGLLIIEASAAGLKRTAKLIFAESQRQVPRDTETLANSGQIEGPEKTPDGSPFVVIGYGYGFEVNPKSGRHPSEYAVPVHERTELRHAPPTKSKYLEDPTYQYSERMGPIIAAEVELAEGYKHAPTMLTLLRDFQESGQANV